MRRPNLKWLIKSMGLVLISGILFLFINSWIASSPFTNKITLPRIRENAPYMRDSNQIDDQSNIKAQSLKRIQQHDVENNVEQSKSRAKDQAKTSYLQLVAPIDQKKDWHDYIQMERDEKRIGLGEHGKRATLENDITTLALQQKMSLENGFNALLSDNISVNRSIVDIRHKDCRKKLYLAKLPTVSVVIPFYNEHFSVLVRSVHSLVNRSPTELLKEIILVDDGSDREYLFDQLDEYIRDNFKIVQVVRLAKRMGLIGARLAGARKATAEVLIFLDSHIETNYNWLPPLLEPIALNKRASVCPFIDVIDHSNFEYRAQDEGARGAFDWEFYYKRLPLLAEDLVDRTKPFRNPVMAGGLFAISTEFFWELGGYDEGLDIWGGEQYELSFKIWMCGGELLDAPCSRVGHIYRGPRNGSPSPRKGDFLHRNYKRVAEVWMDEYKDYLYEHGAGVYDTIDAGDLTFQKSIREKLHCKTFKWFMENVAFDLVKTYPPVEPPDYAYGIIQSDNVKYLCLDTLNKKRHNKIGLFSCAANGKRPQRNQNWALSWHRDLRLRHKTDCLDVQISSKDAPVWLWDCHGQGGNQFWYYNREHKWLQHGRALHKCMEAKIQEKTVVVNDCDVDNKNMRWNFGYVNNTALDNFNKDS